MSARQYFYTSYIILYCIIFVFSCSVCRVLVEIHILYDICTCEFMFYFHNLGLSNDRPYMPFLDFGCSTVKRVCLNDFSILLYQFPSVTRSLFTCSAIFTHCIMQHWGDTFSYAVYMSLLQQISILIMK